MSKAKTKSTEKKELELRQQRAETEKAEAELEREKLYLLRQQREHREKYEYDPSARGVFHFNVPVDGASVALFANAVQRFAHLNEGAGITVYLQTPGGYVLEGLSLYDTLRTLSSQGHTITTVVRGYAASMGAVLLQAGDIRLVGSESYLMIHEIAAGAIGKLHEMKDDVKRCELFNRRLMAILANRTDGKWDEDSLYTKIEAKDWWLTAQEAVENGFADAVG